MENENNVQEMMDVNDNTVSTQQPASSFPTATPSVSSSTAENSSISITALSIQASRNSSSLGNLPQYTNSGSDFVPQGASQNISLIKQLALLNIESDMPNKMDVSMKVSNPAAVTKHIAKNRAMPTRRRRVQASRPVSAHPTTGSRRITQEQIILGHFCMHAMKTLSKVMENNPRKTEVEAELKDHIKSAWKRWVTQKIPRQRLLETVASFVRSSCPEALHIDVIGDFKTWYEREFELQKRRTKQGEQQQRAQVQRQHAVTQQHLQTVAKQQQQQRHPGIAVNASLARAHGIPGSQYARTMNPAMVGNMSAAALAKAQATQGIGQPSFVPGAAAGKSIGSKTVTPRKQQVKQSKAPGKGVAGKSVGSKTLPRQPVVQANVPGLHPKAMKGPSAASSHLMAATVGSSHAGKMVGHKGLGANKAPTQQKPKVRKQAAKTAQKTSGKKTTKMSPKNDTGKQKPMPTQNLMAAASSSFTAAAITSPVTGKRPLDPGSTSPSSLIAKKAKANPKVAKAAIGKKKMGAVTPPTQVRTDKPPVRPDSLKGRPPLAPGSAAGGVPGVGAKPGVAAPATTTPGQVPIRKPRGVDDELNVVHNVVDIDNEENLLLGANANGVVGSSAQPLDYNADLILSGPVLQRKMAACAKRMGLDPTISKEVLEMVSLAVRERLAGMIESLTEIADARLDVRKDEWVTQAVGPDVARKMEDLRKDEERTLSVAAETRVKRRREEEEREAKRLSGEVEQEEKKTKESKESAEQEKKEKLAAEKKRKESSSMSDALSGVVAGVGKRRKRPGARGLAPLVPLSKLGSAGSRSSGSGLPPLQRPGVSSLPPIVKKPGLGKLEPLGKGTGQLVKLGGSRLSSMPGVADRSDAKKLLGAKRNLTMKDVFYYMKSREDMRRSHLLYKWYGRVGLKELREAGEGQKRTG